MRHAALVDPGFRSVPQATASHSCMRIASGTPLSARDEEGQREDAEGARECPARDEDLLVLGSPTGARHASRYFRAP